MVLGDAAAMTRLEAIVHPLVRQARESNSWPRRRRAARRSSVLDVPLLFETGGEHALRRGGRGLGAGRGAAQPRLRAPGHDRGEIRRDPCASRCRTRKSAPRADFIVDSSQWFDHARAQVRDILQAVAKMPRAANRDSAESDAGRPDDEEFQCAKSCSIPRPPASIRCEGHRLVEIGCVELVNRIPSGQTFHAYFNPERDMPAEAFAVHGLSEEFLKDKPFFAEVADDLIAFLGDAPLVIHNAAFDLGFLNAELERVEPAADRARAAGRHAADRAPQASRRVRTGSTICACAMRSTIPAAPSMARCSTPSCWPRSMSS